MGSDWFKETVTLASRVAGTLRTLSRQEMKEEKLPAHWFEAKRHWNMNPPPGARRGDVKKKERQREKKD